MTRLRDLLCAIPFVAMYKSIDAFLLSTYYYRVQYLPKAPFRGFPSRQTGLISCEQAVRDVYDSDALVYASSRL